MWRVLFSLSLIGLVSCDSWFRSYQNPSLIRDLANKKADKKVYVAGEVVRTVPLVSNGAYQIQDNTGKIWILTTSELPNMGNKISIQAQVKYQELPFSEEELYLQEIDTQPYSNN